MCHGLNILKCSGFLFIVFVLSIPLQLVQADNSYGFNLDEGVNILQKEKLRLQYNKRYQQQQLQQRRKLNQQHATASKRVATQPARKPAHRPTPVVKRAPVTQQNAAVGGCTDCFSPSSATSSSHQPNRRVAVPEADSLFLAATNGDVSSIGRLLSQGVNVNAMNSERETALHMAAARGHYSALIYLINHGANINARTTKNWVPLHHAVRFRHANIANYLLKHGSSATIRTSDGVTAIDMARRVRDQRMLNILGAR